MGHPTYRFTRFADQYMFVSTGRTNILKIVEFISLNIPGLFNLCFGDLLADGSIDDEANSNNGDIGRVLSTVIEIIIDFIDQYPERKIFFTGSTDKRTALYCRILKLHYSKYNSKFTVTGVTIENGSLVEIAFDPIKTRYYGFIIQKK